MNPSFNKYKIPVPEVCLSLYFLGNVLQQINRINESVVRAKNSLMHLIPGAQKAHNAMSPCKYISTNLYIFLSSSTRKCNSITFLQCFKII